MKDQVVIGLGVLLLGLAAVGGGLTGDGARGARGAQNGGDSSAPKINKRTFDLKYSVKLAKLPKGKTVRLWVPLPMETPHQECQFLSPGISGAGKPRLTADAVFNNQIAYAEWLISDEPQSETVGCHYEFRVTRSEVRAESANGRVPVKKGESQRFLLADKLVPVDGKPLELIKDLKLGSTPLETARSLYGVVNRHMKYSKEGTGWGKGDAVWACDSKFGNCSDFHSLFISLRGSQKIPAKFEMGFALPQKHGEGEIAGYHCWAWFLPDDKGWLPVDISEANRHPELQQYYFGNLSEDRVAFTVGRDIELVPKQKGPALNFFIYPYAEVDGEVVPQEQIQTTISFKDKEGGD